MAYKKLVSLEASTMISLGGRRKTGEKNPTSAEGYYLGFKTVPDNKKKSGTNNIFYLQTPKGIVGVWGKTDLNKQMQGAVKGQMTLIEVTGTRTVPNGEMHVFEISQDDTNTTDVPNFSTSASAQEEDVGEVHDGGTYDEYGQDEDDYVQDAAPAKSRTAAKSDGLAAEAKRAKVEALLANRKTR